jgi:hypothetical protein
MQDTERYPEEHPAVYAQVILAEWLPEPECRHPDTEEVTGSNPVRPTSSESYLHLCDQSPDRMTSEVTATVSSDRLRYER